MSLDNILTSNFTFNDEEKLLRFKFKMLNSSMLIIALTTFTIALLNQFSINEIGLEQMVVNYIHSLATLLLLWLLRFSKEHFGLISLGLVLVSFLNITSALIFVPLDEFRMMWFYIVVYLAYILIGIRMGLILTIASIIVITLTNIYFDLHLSSLAINTAIFGLIMSSALMRAYTIQVQETEHEIQNQNQKLTYLASVDHLTGIMNKRVFTEVSARYFETAQRHNQNIHILTLDLDNFKGVNDTYGHHIGDLILKRFVEVVQQLLRKSDTFARVGGEEFIILLYKTDLTGSMTVAEKIRKEIKSMNFIHKDRPVIVTTSIGVGRNKPEDQNVTAVLERSDKALYQAKDGGRDRVCLED